MHDLVSERARTSPDAVALASRASAVSYRTLDLRAASLAARLRSLGVGPDVPVGLCLERSPALAIGALGILKAGGAYVALDASYPPDRLAFMLEDSGARLVVTQASVAGSRLLRSPARKVLIDEEDHLDEVGFQPAPPRAAEPHHLAYVIYTSGSTGTPKGVMIEHRNLLNLVQWHVGAFGVTASDRASQVASPAFDATVWELWPYLVMGASVHFPDDGIRADVTALRNWLHQKQITIGFLPTPLAEPALDLQWPPTMHLRFLLTGGDTLHRHPPPGLPFVLVNNYGPTENTVVATFCSVPPARSATRRPSIGGPISNCHLHVVDADLQPVPAGSEGELLIGGQSVARGYLHRPDLTAQRFIPDWLCNAPWERLYRTGDLVRELPDGTMEFLGRLDEQVKIRGFRIEPAEIAAALDAHDAVRSSAVTARQGPNGDPRIVAYIVPNDGPPAPGELRAHLAERLPDYMLPSDVVYLTELPLTTNGKVDREALPEPDHENPGPHGQMTAARTPVEEVLSGMMCGLLGVEQIGVDENFFLLGGHSLLGAQLMVHIYDRFGAELSLRTLFDNPTVETMAARVEEGLLEQLSAMSDEEAERHLAAVTAHAKDGAA